MASKDSAIGSQPFLQELFRSALYKPRQGRMVRQVTAIVVWAVAGVGAWRMHELFLISKPGGALGYLIAVAVAGVGVWLGYRLVNWPKFADFLISVEAELNKVSWPTKRELIRASMVVIFTILFLSILLFLFDFVWKFLFSAIGIA
ncbi:MAG: preprotein translocase subunit SecE [Planctomycetales bacterium]|nr:preprotein translocase subunit SecE [Planctomycetales bacterium]